MTGCFVLHIPVLPSHMSILTFEGTTRTFGMKLLQVSLFWRGPRALLVSNCCRSPFFGGDHAHFWHETAAGLPFSEGTARTFGIKLPQVSLLGRGPRALLASNCCRSPFFGGDCAHFCYETAAGLPFLEGTTRTFAMKLLQVSLFQRGLMGFSMNLCPLFNFRTYSRKCREPQERASFRIRP